MLTDRIEVHTCFADSSTFSLGKGAATWHATSFSAAASEEGSFSLLGLIPSFRLQFIAPQ